MSDSPFWFASEELLTELLRDEIHLLKQLFAKHLKLREYFDFPEATVSQRSACFFALAHRNLMGAIYEVFAGRWQQSPSQGDDEKNVLMWTQNLFAGDAPPWVLEMNEVAELLPSRIYDALPEPLRRGVGFGVSNSPEAETISAAARELSDVQEIQALCRKVIDQQLPRLKRRWSAAISAKKSSHYLKGKAGLERKADLSQYMQGMTDKQQLAFSLKYEYGLRPTEIARRMGIDRTTVNEHLDAANRNLNQNRSFEKRKANLSKSNPED